MSNHITIELCKEDRQRLDEVIAFLGMIVCELKRDPAPTQSEDHPIDATTAHLEPVVEAAPAPVAEEPAAPAVKSVSLAEFQKAVTMVCAKGPKQKEAAKAIVNQYAASVSAVPEDKRAEAMAELAKI